VGGWVCVVGDGAWQYLVAGDGNGDGSRQWSMVLIRRWGTLLAVALSEMKDGRAPLIDAGRNNKKNKDAGHH
jgi:hypothetical protein